MTDGWQEFYRRWARLKPPLRPHADVVSAFRAAVDGARDHVLLLGMTPELADIGLETTAVDNSANTIKHIWPGDTQARRAVHGNWLEMPFHEPRFSAALGDGSLNTLLYSQYPVLFEQLAAVLLPDARVAMRVYETPDVCETMAQLKEQTFGRVIQSFHGFKWCFAMTVVAQRGDPDIPVKLLHEIFTREFPDRESLARATGWPREDIDGIDAYAGNDAVYSFPTRRQTLAAIPAHFSRPHFIDSGTYELAERCPILIADFHP